jgi:hypothetical protein
VRFSHRWGGAIDTCSRFTQFFGTRFNGALADVAGYTGLGVCATRFGARVALDLLEPWGSELTRLKYVRRKPLPYPPRAAAVSAGPTDPQPDGGGGSVRSARSLAAPVRSARPRLRQLRRRRTGSGGGAVQPSVK